MFQSKEIASLGTLFFYSDGTYSGNAKGDITLLLVLEPKALTSKTKNIHEHCKTFFDELDHPFKMDWTDMYRAIVTITPGGDLLELIQHKKHQALLNKLANGLGNNLKENL